MPDRQLTPTSYMVLGMLRDEPGTPYELKARVAAGVGNFWTIQHAQLYSETARLAEEGLLGEEREKGGRRRKTYSITTAGQEALDAWLEVPEPGFGEIRDPGLLKLYLGGDPAMLAAVRAPAHELRLKGWEALKEATRGAEMPEGWKLALEAGLDHERVYLKFWESLL
jgi:DNA-binding PadR family transcriptional regulator